VKRSTSLAATDWTRSSLEARKFAERRLAELRPARSPITAPTGRFFCFLTALPSISGRLRRLRAWLAEPLR
jgi:hypothetical protein